MGSWNQIQEVCSLWTLHPMAACYSIGAMFPRNSSNLVWKIIYGKIKRFIPRALPTYKLSPGSAFTHNKNAAASGVGWGSYLVLHRTAQDGRGQCIQMELEAVARVGIRPGHRRQHSHGPFFVKATVFLTYPQGHVSSSAAYSVLED